MDYKPIIDPQLIIICGGPGSGKSFFYERLKRKGAIPIDAVIHDPDLLMQAIPRYQEEAKINPSLAFQKWELPSRQTANELLMRALIARQHIVYIRSCALPDSFQFIQNAKKKGYRIHVHMLTCDIDIAISRAKEREKITKRHCPIPLIMERHQAVLAQRPKIEALSDQFFCYQNNNDGQEPVLICN